MAHGDEQTVNHGRFEGWTRRSIDIASATGATDLVPSSASKKIKLGPCTLVFIGTGDADIIENGGETLYGPFEIGANADGGTVEISEDHGIITDTASTAIQATRATAQAISGTIIYKYV